MNGPEALRWAAAQIIGNDRVFDSDHDNALVAARLTELADRIETVAGGDARPLGGRTA